MGTEMNEIMSIFDRYKARVARVGWGKPQAHPNIRNSLALIKI